MSAEEPAASILAITFFGVSTRSLGKRAEVAGAGLLFRKTPGLLRRTAAPLSPANKKTGRNTISERQTSLRHVDKFPPGRPHYSCDKLNGEPRLALVTGVVTTQRMATNLCMANWSMRLLGAREIQKPLLDIGTNELGAEFIAHVESQLSLSEESLNVRLCDTDKCSVIGDAADQSIEDFADSILHGDGSKVFRHVALDLSCSIFFLRAV